MLDEVSLRYRSCKVGWPAVRAWLAGGSGYALGSLAQPYANNLIRGSRPSWPPIPPKLPTRRSPTSPQVYQSNEPHHAPDCFFHKFHLPGVMMLSISVAQTSIAPPDMAVFAACTQQARFSEGARYRQRHGSSTASRPQLSYHRRAGETCRDSNG